MTGIAREHFGWPEAEPQRVGAGRSTASQRSGDAEGFRRPRGCRC